MVVILKKKPKSLVDVAATSLAEPPQIEVMQGPQLSDFADQIDEVGQIQEAITKLDAKIAEKAKTQIAARAELQKKLTPLLKELRETLDTHLTDDNPDKVCKELGQEFVAEMGKKGNQRKITDMNKVKEILDASDKSLFMKLVSLKLEDADKYMTEPQRNECIENTRTKRPIEVKKRD